MSFTVLRDIETCPLRWSLRRAAYPELWAGAGYPPALRLGTLSGQVVHVALERIVGEIGRRLAAIPKPSPNEPARSLPSADAETSEASNGLDILVNALRRLGGITTILEGVLADLVRSWAANPRVGSRAREWEGELRRQVPALRQEVQQLLAHLDVPRVPRGSDSPPRVSPATIQATSLTGRAATEYPQRPLESGVHAEVPLNNRELDWYGKADLLRLDERTCQIVDFKTGAAKDDHVLQLRIYALLWQREVGLNPLRRPVCRLTVVYPTGPSEVPAPSIEDLDTIATDLASRSDAARAAVAAPPPEARPGYAACEWCDVRQLCDRYWDPATRAMFEKEEQTTEMDVRPVPSSADVEIRVLSAQGEWSWHAIVSAVGALTGGLTPGTRVLVRGRPRDTFFPTLVRPGARLRVIGAQHLTASEESAGYPVLALGRSTEVFLVPTAQPTGFLVHAPGSQVVA